MKFSWVTFPVVKYLIPYTDTIPIFSMARSRFLKEMRYLKSNKSLQHELKHDLNIKILIRYSFDDTNKTRYLQTPDLLVDLISSSK